MTEAASCNIPLETKRAVRRRCGYGCIICGLPLYHYDHMIPWAEVRRHEFHNLTLLCPHRHEEKTKGLLTLDDVRRADRAPVNKRIGRAQPYRLRFSGQTCEIKAGTQQTFRASRNRTGDLMVPVMIKGVAPLGFRFEGKHILFNLCAFDHTGAKTLSIEDSEIVVYLSSWDVEFVANRLVVRSRDRQFDVELEFEPRNRVVIWRYAAIVGSTSINFTPTSLEIRDPALPTFFVAGTGVVDAAVGITVGDPRPDLSVGIQFP